MSEPRQSYQNPPLIEALCVFTFEEGEEQDPTIPGLLYGKIKDSFPKRKKRRSFEVTIPDPAAEKEISQRVQERSILLSEDGRRFVQLGSNTLALNFLSPYPGWPVFLDVVKRLLATYLEVASQPPLRAVNLRYINRVDLPATQVEVEDYVLAAPQIPEPLPQTFVGWAQHVQIPFEEPEGLLTLRTGSASAGEHEPPAFMLDLEFASGDMANCTAASTVAWIEAAHDIIEDAFETCLGPLARENLDKEDHPHDEPAADPA